MKLKGKIRKEDLSGGVFVIDADDGETYQLAGGDASLRKAGQTVELEGDVDDGAVGIGMTGDPTFRVTKWKAK